MKISCIDKEIHDILSSGYYKIPRFQRPYSWGKEQVEEFWDDVVGNKSDYFIGSIVLFKSDNKGEEFGVVDGQQRLTTITMFLSAIRNTLNKENFKDLAEGIQTYIEKRNRNNQLRYIIDTETSYPYLQEYIQKNGLQKETDYPSGKEEENLKIAFKALTELVDGVITKIKNGQEINKDVAIKSKLEEIRDKVLDIKLITIQLDNKDDAYIVFETLNTRGKDLTVSDLVKNHLTKLIKAENIKVDIAKDNWLSIVKMIESSDASMNVDSFLHHFWLSKYQFTSILKLFNLLKEKIKSKEDAENLLNELLNDSKTYREIHEKNFRKWDKQDSEIEQSLDALLIFGVKQPLPVVLAVLREYKSKSIKLKQVKRILKAIENFHFVFTAVTSQRSSGGISKMYAKAARELTNAKTVDEKVAIIDELIEKLKNKIPTLNEFKANFLELFYSNQFTKRKRLLHYILSKSDKYHRKGNGLVINYNQMTIEHLASQNPKDKILSDESVAQIGNLILLDADLNNRLSNKPFSEKRLILTNSKIQIDEIIKNATQWDKEMIEERTLYLAKISYEEIWKF